MVEDISAQARLSVDIAMLGALLMTVVALMIVGTDLLNYFENRIIHAYQDISNVTLNNLAAEQFTTSATAYKAIESLSTAVNTVTVTRADGTIKTLYVDSTGDDSFDYLLKEPSTHYSVSISRMNGQYSFKLQEVD